MVGYKLQQYGQCEPNDRVLYEPSSDETIPLLPKGLQHTISRNGLRWIKYGILGFFVINLYLHFANCPLYPGTMNAIRHDWQREVARHDAMREEWRREEEERQRLNMFWGKVTKAHTCITYGTREYTAQLMNLPTSWEHRVEACKATTIEIHGNSYLPKSCEDQGPGIVIGRWEVDQHEPDCAPFWIWYKDKGCTSLGSGKRRVEHYLENLPIGGDWREFCATTPAQFHGMEFKGAQECFQSSGNGGTWGYWEVDDASCS